MIYPLLLLKPCQLIIENIMDDCLVIVADLFCRCVGWYTCSVIEICHRDLTHSLQSAIAMDFSRVRPLVQSPLPFPEMHKVHFFLWIYSFLWFPPSPISDRWPWLFITVWPAYSTETRRMTFELHIDPCLKAFVHMSIWISTWRLVSVSLSLCVFLHIYSPARLPFASLPACSYI